MELHPANSLQTPFRGSLQYDDRFKAVGEAESNEQAIVESSIAESKPGEFFSHTIAVTPTQSYSTKAEVIAAEAKVSDERSIVNQAGIHLAESPHSPQQKSLSLTLNPFKEYKASSVIPNMPHSPTGDVPGRLECASSVQSGESVGNNSPMPARRKRFSNPFKGIKDTADRYSKVLGPSKSAIHETPQGTGLVSVVKRARRRNSSITIGRACISLQAAKTDMVDMKAEYIRDHADDFDWEEEEKTHENQSSHMMRPQEEEYKSSWEKLLETVIDPTEKGCSSMDPARYSMLLKEKSERFVSRNSFKRNSLDLKGDWQISENPMEGEIENGCESNPLTRQWEKLYHYFGGDNCLKPYAKHVSWGAFKDMFRSASISMHRYSEDSKKAVAEYQGGFFNGTLLSYVCRLQPQPPLNVIKMLVDASPETLTVASSDVFTPLSFIFDRIAMRLEGIEDAGSDVAWDNVIDTFELVESTEYASELLEMQWGERGDTLLHHVLLKNSPPLFVVHAFLKASPNSTLSRNSRGSTALHFAVQKNLSIEIVLALLEADKGKESLTIIDAEGCTPLHLACINGVVLEVMHSSSYDLSRDVIEALLKADNKNESLNMKDLLGRSPLFHAISKGLSPEVVELLIESSSVETVENLLRIIIGMPLRERRIQVGDIDHSGKTESSSSSGPQVSFCGAQIQDISLRYFPCLAKAIATNRQYQLLLNSRSSDRIFTAVMMLDFYVYTLLIIGFTSISDIAFRSLSGSVSCVDSPWNNVLYAICTYLLGREVIQAKNEGMNWLIDVWNWLDMTNIVLVAVSVTSMKTQSESMTTRYLVMVTGFIVWTMMLSFLRLTFLPFSVFVNGVTNIVCKLIPFLISSFIVLGAFVHLYYIDSIGTDQCRITSIDDDFGRRYEGEDSKFCSYSGTFVKIYSMFVGGLDEYLFTNGGVEERNWRIEDHDMKYSTMWVSVLFGLLVQILLLNVIIVIVNESWDSVSRRGSEVFWENRLNVLLEVKGFTESRIASVSEKRCRTIAKPIARFVGKTSTWLILETEPTSVDKASSSNNNHHGVGFFEHMVSSQLNGFALAAWEEWNTVLENKHGGCLRRIRIKIFVALKVVYKIVIFVLLVAVSFLGGILTLGALWPRSFRHFLFGSNEMENNDVPGEMSREIRALFKQGEHYENILKETKNYHDLLNQKDAELSRLNMQLLQQVKEENNLKAVVEDLKQQNEENFRLQQQTCSRLETKLTEMLELLVVEKLFA